MASRWWSRPRLYAVGSAVHRSGCFVFRLLFRPSRLIPAALLLLGPTQARAASAPQSPICEALVKPTVDVAAVRRALERDPTSIDATCRVARSGPDTAVEVFGFFFMLGLPTIMGATQQPYGTLELAVRRGSSDAVALLRDAGADPTHRTKHTSSAIGVAVALDLARGGTTWTHQVLQGWSGELSPGVLNDVLLDRLFFAPELEQELLRHGYPPHGTDAHGMTWLHRSLYDPSLSFRQRGAFPVSPGEGADAARAALSVDLVLARGVPVDQADRKGFSALYYAAVTGNWAAWDALLEAGARLEEAAEYPSSLLEALVLAGGDARFQQTVRTMTRDGHLQASDLSELASQMVLDDETERCGLAAKVGATPSDFWWMVWSKKGHAPELDRALGCGFLPPFKVVQRAVRERRWSVARKLARHAALTPGQVRRLQIAAALRGAPPKVHKRLRKMLVQARKNGRSTPVGAP